MPIPPTDLAAALADGTITANNIGKYVPGATVVDFYILYLLATG